MVGTVVDYILILPLIAANMTAESLLYNSVFLNYNKDIRPIGDGGHSVSVNLHISLHQVSDLVSLLVSSSKATFF